MSRHTCHLPGCNTACPPRYLFCRLHWSMVPRDLQLEVYATVGDRGSAIDASWAPWWRAQAQATAAVLRAIGKCDDEALESWLAKEMAVADAMERPR